MTPAVSFAGQALPEKPLASWRLGVSLQQQLGEVENQFDHLPQQRARNPAQARVGVKKNAASPLTLGHDLWYILVTTKALHRAAPLFDNSQQANPGGCAPPRSRRFHAPFDLGSARIPDGNAALSPKSRNSRNSRSTAQMQPQVRQDLSSTRPAD